MESTATGIERKLLSMLQIGPTIQFGPILGLFIFILGCGVLRPCFFYWRKQRQLRLQGITVQGQVIERYYKPDTRGQPWYYLTCRYSYEGQTYVSDQPVWRFQYERVEALVSVRCLPKNPEVASVFEDDFQRTEWVQRTILGVIFCIVGATIAIGAPLGAFTSKHP